jgi:hypothetical protein
MKFSVVLMKSEQSDINGFPIYIRVSEKRDRPVKMIGRAWPEHFSDDAGIVLENTRYFVSAP